MENLKFNMITLAVAGGIGFGLYKFVDKRKKDEMNQDFTGRNILYNSTLILFTIVILYDNIFFINSGYIIFSVGIILLDFNKQ